MKLLALSLALLTAAEGTVAAAAEGDDPRIAVIYDRPGVASRLEVAVGTELVVLFPRGEPLTSVSLSMPGGWDLEEDDAAGKITIRPERPLPDTRLDVLTATHSYTFMLSDLPVVSGPLVVRVVGASERPVSSGGAQATIAPVEASWRLSGNRELWPSLIRDDGTRTYLEWPEDQPIPAVFAVDRLGREEMVDGYMRGQTFTIDRVYARLLFRIDRAMAEARRKPAKVAS